MDWQLFHLTYEVLSPLHIGYHKVGNVQRTRYYIPARNFWAAVTERLTRSGFNITGVEGDYRKIGTWVKEHVTFSYFFVRDESGLPLYPYYSEDGLRYGSLLESHFERRYLSAHVTTALDAATTSAAEGSLHEVESIVPYDKEGKRISVSGWVWLDESGIEQLAKRWEYWLGELQIGGERRYGFGRLRLLEDGWTQGVELLPGYTAVKNGARPQIKIAKNKPLLAHTVVVPDLKVRGEIEPFLGRETRDSSDKFGQALTAAQICWVPGTQIEENITVQFEKDGLWTFAPS